MNLPDNGQARILIFSPHPDDAEFSMGGTIISMVHANFNVNVAVMTDGERHPAANRKDRWIEQERASSLGQYTTQRLSLPDCGITLSNSLEVCINTILNYRPNLVFAPFPKTGDSLPIHPDHEVAGEAVRQAVRKARIPCKKGRRHAVDHLLYYLLPLGVTPTLLFDISQVKGELTKLWSCFASQLTTKRRSIDLLMAERMNLALHSNGILAEAFRTASPLVISPKSLANLIAK